MSMILYLAGKNQRRDYGFLSSLIYELFLCDYDENSAFEIFYKRAFS